MPIFLFLFAIQSYYVKFSNEPGSDLIGYMFLILTAVLRQLLGSFFFYYEHLFDVPQHSRTDNDVSGVFYLIPAAG